MGDIIQNFRVRTRPRGAGKRLRLYFDTGSPRTFIGESVANALGGVISLESPARFHGLGKGTFHAAAAIHLYIRMLGLWVPHFTYVVPDEVLGARFDVLIGHDLMQLIDARARPRRRQVELDRGAIEMALQVR